MKPFGGFSRTAASTLSAQKHFLAFLIGTNLLRISHRPYNMLFQIKPAKSLEQHDQTKLPQHPWLGRLLLYIQVL
jgi:hypothetical protein